MELRNIFNALADPTRLAIVQRLAKDGPQSASVLGEPFDMSMPAVSQHLRVLRNSGLVRVQKDAQRRIYSLNRSALEQVADWADTPTPEPKPGGLHSFLSRRASAG